jgi:dihydroneopterin aldolase
MPLHATIELRDLRLPCDLGTYGPNDVVPDAHLLDLTLIIDPGLVLIEGDGMDKVFDYDPLVADITRLARDGHYETQEWLITRIVVACARYSQIQRLEAFLRKGPVLPDSGTLGVRLRVGQTELATLRH